MKKLIPPVLMAFCLLLMILLHWQWRIAVFLRPPWTYLGAVPLAAGVLSAMAGRRALARAGTTVSVLCEPVALVTDGIYRRTRNPIYLGFALVLVGVWMFTGMVSGILPVILYVIVTDRVYIRREEGLLAQKFGRSFEEYCRRTRRWI
jgi:protein-S-isoprenylcysteine O-methyltransferase Ste14